MARIDRTGIFESRDSTGQKYFKFTSRYIDGQPYVSTTYRTMREAIKAQELFLVTAALQPPNRKEADNGTEKKES